MDKAKVMNIVNAIAPILVSLGAIDIGLRGFFDYSIIEQFVSGDLRRVVFAIIGLAAIWNIGLIPKLLKK